MIFIIVVLCTDICNDLTEFKAVKKHSNLIEKTFPEFHKYMEQQTSNEHIR